MSDAASARPLRSTVPVQPRLWPATVTLNGVAVYAADTESPVMVTVESAQWPGAHESLGSCCVTMVPEALLGGRLGVTSVPPGWLVGSGDGLMVATAVPTPNAAAAM